MQVQYTLEIAEPQTHMVSVKLKAQRLKGEDRMRFFLPSWSPGSYLMREYARNIRTFKAINEKGEYYHFEQVNKSTWEVDFTKHAPSTTSEFELVYDIYCHEVGVRNCHVDITHAFLHGPCLFMGIEGVDIVKPKLTVKFPPLWSKITTGMTDIGSGNNFEYTAANYDDLLDCPIEIGCHETDGFKAAGKTHHLAFWGEHFKADGDLKTDMKKIVEHIAGVMGDIPYEDYYFITHFAPNLYGGLEHKNSTALHFDGRKLSSRKDYLNWLCLVSHEYFHTWNVKRIRPAGLGPFDYQNEAYSNMLWLAEGLTSFVDELFVYQCGLCTAEEYLEMQVKNLALYLSLPGRKFHTLEQSSFNAWIKLYRPDENSRNSTISYYLKGGIAFMLLHLELLKQGKNTGDLLNILWSDYKENPERGINKKQFLTMLEKISNKELAEKFDGWVSTTEEFDFETPLKEIGVELEWEKSDFAQLGANFKYLSDRAVVASVTLDTAAYRSGINAGDELIAINGQRVLSDDIVNLEKWLTANVSYKFQVARLGRLIDIPVVLENAQKKLIKLNIKDQQVFEKSMLSFKRS
jgi:predicted metalloprotease with PDZ domain